ncbi:MAG: hypothetical protein AAF591_20140 [Verrucomicrobiota bacterium]
MAKRDASSKGKNDQVIYLPGPEFWEQWSGSERFGFSRIETTEWSGVAPERVPTAAAFVFPVAAAYAVPFWASTDDPSLLEDVGDMQLEKLGVKPDAVAGQLREYRVVDRVGNRSLVVASVLSVAQEPEYPKHPPEQFLISPYLYPLPSDAVLVWRELGRLVVAVTRTDTPIYFHTLSSEELDGEAVQEIKVILMQLRMQGVIEDVDEMVVWGRPEAGGTVEQLATKELGMRARYAEAPPPRLPSEVSRLVPEEVAHLRQRRETVRKIKNAALLVGLAYLVVIGVVAGLYLRTKQKAAALRTEIAAVAPETDGVRDAQMRWFLLEKAIDVDGYPIELLHKCVQILPAKGVQLTEFQVSGDEIFMMGNASKYPVAMSFKNDLEKAPLLAEFIWDFETPDIQGDNSATFSVSGRKNDGTAQAQ